MTNVLSLGQRLSQKGGLFCASLLFRPTISLHQIDLLWKVEKRQ